MDAIIHLAPSLNLPNTIPHNAWTRVTSQKLLHLLRVLPATFLQNLMFPKKRPPTRIHRRSGGQASRNAEKFLATKGPSHDVIASNDLLTPMVFVSRNGQLNSSKLPRPIHHLSMLLWQDLNDHHLDAKKNPPNFCGKFWGGGAHKNAINPRCGVCVEGLLHMTICLKCGSRKSS